LNGEQPEPITHYIKEFPLIKPSKSVGKEKIRMKYTAKMKKETIVAICSNNESLV